MFPNTAKGKPQGRFIVQNTQSKDRDFPHWISLYVDNIALILPTRGNASKTTNLALKHLRKFGLQMHTGSKQKNSKTELLHIPKKSSQTITADTIPIEHYDESRITFTTHFTHLGSIISSDLSDDADVNNIITKSTKSFGFLRSLTFCNHYLLLKIENYVYMAITVNLLLWGS